MKKIAAIAISVLFMVTAAGCGSASKEDGGRPESADGGAAQDVFDDSGIPEEDGSGYDLSPEDGFGYDEGQQDDFGDDESLTDDFDYDAWLQEYIGETDGNSYESYKEVYGRCDDAVNTAVARFFELFDTDFFNSDAVAYHQCMSYYGSLCSPLERIFSGDDDKIEKALREGFYADNITWSVEGGTAVITFVAENADVIVTVEYDGSSTAQIIYTADGEITQRASFITTDQYHVIAYSYGTMTIIDAVYANGDAYYIYDPSGASVEFSVYKGSFDDPSKLIGDRPYLAIIDGALVY